MQSDNFDQTDTVDENTSANPPYEAIRFGSTEESGRAIYRWAQTHAASVYAGVLFGDRDRLQVMVNGRKEELYKGDYLALVPVDPEYVESHAEVGGFNNEATHQFRMVTDAEWAILFGEGAQHAMPEETQAEGETEAAGD